VSFFDRVQDEEAERRYGTPAYRGFDSTATAGAIDRPTRLLAGAFAGGILSSLISLEVSLFGTSVTPWLSLAKTAGLGVVAVTLWRLRRVAEPTAARLRRDLVVAIAAAVVTIAWIVVAAVETGAGDPLRWLAAAVTFTCNLVAIGFVVQRRRGGDSRGGNSRGGN
jgi:hypothetical protein